MQYKPPSQLNILLADDEASTSSAIAYAMRHYGHHVDVVGSGDEALARLMKEPDKYELLITDHNMKLGSGLELVGKLKGSKFRGGIVVVSGFLTVEVKQAYRALGVSALVDKPFELPELREAVMKAAAKTSETPCETKTPAAGAAADSPKPRASAPDQSLI